MLRPSPRKLGEESIGWLVFVWLSWPLPLLLLPLLLPLLRVFEARERTTSRECFAALRADELTSLLHSRSLTPAE